MNNISAKYSYSATSHIIQKGAYIARISCYRYRMPEALVESEELVSIKDPILSRL